MELNCLESTRERLDWLSGDISQMNGRLQIAEKEIDALQWAESAADKRLKEFADDWRDERDRIGRRINMLDGRADAAKQDALDLHKGMIADAKIYVAALAGLGLISLAEAVAIAALWLRH